jgi:hypothetical protein
MIAGSWRAFGSTIAGNMGEGSIQAGGHVAVVPRLQLDLCVQSCRICVLRSSSSEEEGVVMRTRLRPGS